MPFGPSSSSQTMDSKELFVYLFNHCLTFLYNFKKLQWIFNLLFSLRYKPLTYTPVVITEKQRDYFTANTCHGYFLTPHTIAEFCTLNHTAHMGHFSGKSGLCDIELY